MRIIGGRYSGRRLASLIGSQTRPTGDRVREALFNIWQARVEGAVFWDAYAGTGAVGLEAYSRGAKMVVFSELDRQALRTLRRNLALFGEDAALDLHPVSAERLLAEWARQGRQFDLIFLDPPWRVGLSGLMRDQLAGVLRSGGVAVVETRQDDSVGALRGLTQRWTRRYGDTRMTGYTHPVEIGEA